MDNLDLALAIQAKLPDCNIIFRLWPDDDLVKRFTPQDWVAHVVSRAPVNLWFYAGNEMGFSDEVLKWTAEVIEYSAVLALKLVVGNFSSGTPEPEDWKRPAARRLLELCHQHRNRVVLGLHEYACGVVTSGFIGSDPVFIQETAWPRKVDDVVMWHMGRLHRLLEACDHMGIQYPRIVLTEAGFDNMADVKAWAEKLIKTPGYDSIRGWKSLERQWQAWWNWSPQQAYYEQMMYAASVIYQDAPVEAMLLFSWGASSEAWKQFDLADAYEFQALLEMEQEVFVPRGGERYTVTFTGFKVLNLRDRPGGADVGDALAGDTLYVYPASDMKVGEYTWVQVDHYPVIGEGKKGVWVAATLPGLTWTLVQPPPSDPPITWLTALTPDARDLAQFLKINKEALGKLGLLDSGLKPMVSLFSEMAVLLDQHFEV